MAADAGLIKSASQAYRSQDPNFKLGESLRYGFDKISQGITKGQEIKRAQEEKENLRKEKQAASLKRSADVFQNSIVEVSGHAKTDKQTSLVLNQAKEWRSQSNEYFKIMEESSVDSPEYAEAQEGLLKIRTGMQNTVDSFDELNAIRLTRSDIAKNNGYADFNTVEGVDGVDDNTILGKTEAFVREDVDYAFDDNGFLRISDGQNEDGTANYVSISDYDSTLARVADASVATAFTAITDDLQKQGAKGDPMDKVDLEHNFNIQRERLVKPGQDKTDQLLTFFTDNPIPGVSLKEGNEELIRNLQSKDIEVRTKAKKQAVDYLFGETDKGNGRLYQVAEQLHKGKLDIYNKKKENEHNLKLEIEKAKAGKSSFSGAQEKDQKVINALDVLFKKSQQPASNLNVLRTLAKPNKYPIDFNGEMLDKSKADKMLEISKNNLTNDLRKHLGDNKLTVNTKIDDNGVTKFMLSGTDGRSSGDYTIEELFAPVTDPNGLAYKYATLSQVLGKE